MINPIAGSPSLPELSHTTKPAAPQASANSKFPEDTVSISPQAHAAAAGDVDHDGDSH